MIIADSQIHQVAVDVLHVMLGMQVDPFEGDNPPPAKYYAYVNVSGPKQAAVEVSVCKTSANEIARAMFGSEGDAPIDEVADAVSELVNMVGGNLKSMFGADCNLSIPEFKQLRDLSFDQKVEQAELRVSGGWVRIAFKMQQ